MIFEPPHLRPKIGEWSLQKVTYYFNWELHHHSFIPRDNAITKIICQFFHFILVIKKSPSMILCKYKLPPMAFIDSQKPIIATSSMWFRKIPNILFALP